MTSVCTGALVLAAGLLRGRRATTHWGAFDLLSRFGAVPTQGRIVRDGHFITAGGVTGGIDFGLTIAAELAGRTEAETIQLSIEYAPGSAIQCRYAGSRFRCRTGGSPSARADLARGA